jgi:simple sugar transport system permease protein
MRLWLERRFEQPSAALSATSALAGFAVALLLGACLLTFSGYSAATGYMALIRGSTGSLRALVATIDIAVPIGLCAIGIALAYRANLWNIGAEGQLYMGAFAAAGVGLSLPAGTPSILALPIVLAAGLIAGAAWAAVAGVLKVWVGANEILSTLMLNYIAILWVDYLVSGPWADPLIVSFPYSPPLPAADRIGTIGGTVHWSVLIFLGALATLAAIDRGSRWGYELRVLGAAPQAARYGGMAISKLTVTALAAAGACAGVAGAVLVMAGTGRLQSGLSPGYGFMAILVAWLAGRRPIGILLASLLYAGLLNGGFFLQMARIPPSLATILQALILVCVLAGFTLRSYRIRIRRKRLI